jgi:hypothetical protein
LFTAIRRSALCFFGAVLLSGCAPYGAIYSDTISPYTENFRATPVGSKRCVIHDYQLREPLTRLRLSAEWTTDVIVNETRKAGITEIYYMDIRTVSVLFGIYRQKSLLVYGD